MQQEIEAKFLNIDFDSIRSKLKELDATCVHSMRLMHRTVLDYPDRRLDGQDSWIRVRDEADKITLTYKTIAEKKLGGATEIEVIVSSYQKTIEIFEAVGMVVYASQDSKRETRQLGDAEVVLDEWPWLNPYIEIEADSEAAVKKAAKQLGLDWELAVFGGITTAYRAQYPDIRQGEHISTIPEIKFDLPRPDWFVKN
ncbi:MAG: class IV adenylate cyclase [Candidatus Saccharimonadales bacterium]